MQYTIWTFLWDVVSTYSSYCRVAKCIFMLDILAFHCNRYIYSGTQQQKRRTHEVYQKLSTGTSAMQRESDEDREGFGESNHRSKNMFTNWGLLKEFVRDVKMRERKDLLRKCNLHWSAIPTIFISVLHVGCAHWWRVDQKEIVLKTLKGYVSRMVGKSCLYNCPLAYNGAFCLRWWALLLPDNPIEGWTFCLPLVHWI